MVNPSLCWASDTSSLSTRLMLKFSLQVISLFFLVRVSTFMRTCIPIFVSSKHKKQYQSFYIWYFTIQFNGFWFEFSVACFWWLSEFRWCFTLRLFIILLVRFGLLSGHLFGNSWALVLIVFCVFVILFISHFGFESRICFLIASVSSSLLSHYLNQYINLSIFYHFFLHFFSWI